MKHAIDAAVPSSPRRLRSVLPSLLVIGVLGLSACATPVGGISPSPTPSEATVSPSVNPSVSPSPRGAPSPTASASATPGAIFNGEILIVTSEVRDGNLEVSAMVSGVSETGGTCTLTVESTGATASVEGNEGKEVTYCGLMSIPVGADAPADLAFQVTYSSPAVQAQSSVITIEPTP